MAARYLIALGSNRRHPRFGTPEHVLAAALRELDRKPFKLLAASRTMRSVPLGPSLRRYANGAALVRCQMEPPQMLGRLKAIETAFGRRRGGQRWTARVLDLDLVLWSGGAWSSPGLTVPHPYFRTRDFVLVPACSIAPDWRDPLSALSLRQLHARLTRPRRMPR